MKRLINSQNAAKRNIVRQMLGYVQEKGEPLSQRHCEVFGLIDEEQHGYGVTKVLSFYDQEGCSFSECNKINAAIPAMKSGQINEDRIYEQMTHTSYQCLYVLRCPDGTEQLKYYRFINGGIAFDEDQAEAEYGLVSELSLLDIHYIIQGLKSVESTPVEKARIKTTFVKYG